MTRILTAAFLVLAACGGARAQTPTAKREPARNCAATDANGNLLSEPAKCIVTCRDGWMPVTIGDHSACIKRDTLFMEPER